MAHPAAWSRSATASTATPRCPIRPLARGPWTSTRCTTSSATARGSKGCWAIHCCSGTRWRRRGEMTREHRIRRVMGALGLVLAIGLLVAIAAGAEPFEPDSYRPGQDARAYWSVSMDDPYVPGSVGQESAYLYSPAFLQVLAPLRALPWTAFLVLWSALLLAVLFWLSGPLLFAPLIVLTFPELWGGNITILLAAALVLGFRRPGAWSLALLTKVTPAIGLLWFAVRREWRAVLEAAAVTGAIVAVSAALAPTQWSDWFQLLASSTGSSTVP